MLSCAKDEEDTEEDTTKRDALTSGTWVLTGYLRDYAKDEVYEENTYLTFDICAKDNTYIFQIDGTWIADEGLFKCYSDDPQVFTSSWSFSDDQTRIQFGVQDYHIEELTATTLRVRGKESWNVIYTINVEKTFTKQ